MSVNAEVLEFTLFLAVATALLAGLAPAWRASQADVSTLLNSTGRAIAGRREGTAIGRTLVFIEMACAMVLLVGAGLLAGSIIHLRATPLGFNPDGLLTMAVDLPRTALSESSQRADFYDRLIPTLTAVPAVEVALDTTSLLGTR
jgi:putative ABC transport system permease protein